MSESRVGLIGVIGVTGLKLHGHALWTGVWGSWNGYGSQGEQIETASADPLVPTLLAPHRCQRDRSNRCSQGLGWRREAPQWSPVGQSG